ncbi:MAG: MoaD/ThiS family protein [Bacteroidota bacterium]
MSELPQRTVRILLFGPIREITGVGEIALELEEASTGDAAFEALARRYPALNPWRQSLRIAVNRSYVPADHPLHPGDEVGLVPPVSGG